MSNQRQNNPGQWLSSRTPHALLMLVALCPRILSEWLRRHGQWNDDHATAAHDAAISNVLGEAVSFPQAVENNELTQVSKQLAGSKGIRIHGGSN